MNSCFNKMKIFHFLILFKPFIHIEFRIVRKDELLESRGALRVHGIDAFVAQINAFFDIDFVENVRNLCLAVH